MHFHLSVHTWWCGKLFFFSLHTTILCIFAHLMNHLTHHHSSQFSFCRWWHRKLFFFFFLHTTICMCHPISLIHIHHNIHPIVTCSFICTKLSAPISKWCWVDWTPTITCIPKSLDVDFARSPRLSAISRIGFVTSYYIYITLLVCTCHYLLHFCHFLVGVMFGGRKIGMWFRHRNYMGASFHAPCAAPGQRQMEMHHNH